MVDENAGDTINTETADEKNVPSPLSILRSSSNSTDEQHNLQVENDKDEEEEDDELRRLLVPDVRDLPLTPPSAIQTNFVTYFALDLIKPGHDQYVHRHANGLCVVGLAPSHVTFKDKGGVTSVDFNVGKSDRSGIKVTGKRKKNAQHFEPNTALCRVCCNDDSYIVRCCVKGSLLEVNERLIKQPELLNSSLLDMAPGGGKGRGNNGRARSTSSAMTNLGPTSETTRAPKRVRGHLKGLATDRIFRATGSKLKVYFAPGDNRPSGKNRGFFTSEIGIVVRNHAPLQVVSWKNIQESEKRILIERVLTKFDADISDPMVERYILKKMSDRYNDYRNTFHLHFKKFTTVEEARRNKHRRTAQEDWDYLCTLFSSEKFQNRSIKCSENRSKLPFNHCGGSKPFVEYRYEDEDGEPLEEPKGDIQLFHDTHFDGEHGWVDLVSKLRYQDMDELRKSAENEMTEAEICRKVLGKRSRYIKGRGFGPLPESFTHGQETRATETEDLRAEVQHLKELVAGYNEINAQLIANQTRTEALLKRFQEALAATTSPFNDT